MLFELIQFLCDFLDVDYNGLFFALFSILWLLPTLYWCYINLSKILDFLYFWSIVLLPFFFLWLLCYGIYNL